MVFLPIEIHEMIVDELIKSIKPTWYVYPPWRGLAKYSIVSKIWQSLIERRNFESIKITSDEVSSLRLIARKRSGYLKQLGYEVLLPPYDLEILRQTSHTHETEINSKAFSAAIKELFAELAHWSPTVRASCTANGLELRLSHHSPSDPVRINADREYFHSYGPCVHFLPFHSEVPLQSPGIVDKLVYYQSIDSRPLHPASICILASFLPNLRCLKGDFVDNGDAGPDYRMGIRAEFAECLFYLPTSVQELFILYRCAMPQDKNSPAMRFTSIQGQEVLSRGIRLLSQHLTVVRLQFCVVGLDLLWPNLQDEQQGLLPFWPHLKVLDLGIYPVLADGSWLFAEPPIPHHDPVVSEPVPEADVEDGNSDVSGDSYEAIEYEPVASRFNHLYILAATAAARMPKLEKPYITNADQNMDDLPWIDGYIPFLGFFFEDNGKDRTAIWDTPTRYRPSKRVIRAWQATKGEDVQFKVQCTVSGFPEGYKHH